MLDKPGANYRPGLLDISMMSLTVSNINQSLLIFPRDHIKGQKTSKSTFWNLSENLLNPHKLEESYSSARPTG